MWLQSVRPSDNWVRDYFFALIDCHWVWSARTELIKLCEIYVRIAVEKRTSIRYPNIPRTPSLRFTRPRFDAGSHTSRTSIMNCWRVAARALWNTVAWEGYGQVSNEGFTYAALGVEIHVHSLHWASFLQDYEFRAFLWSSDLPDPQKMD